MARDIAGIVVDASGRGLIVKANRMLNPGSHLVDVRNQPVGRVVDVIGPVNAPYLLVKPGKGANVQKLVNRELYTP